MDKIEYKFQNLRGLHKLVKGTELLSQKAYDYLYELNVIN